MNADVQKVWAESLIFASVKTTLIPNIMEKLKTYLLLFMLATASALAGCSDDDDAAPSGVQPLIIQGQAYSFNSETGTTWHGAQEVGVFLLNAADQSLPEKYANMKYRADNRLSSGYFVPDAEPVYLADGETVDAIAYHPYKSSGDLFADATSQYLYPVDLSNQKGLKPDAFVYANNARGLTNRNYKARMELRPVLSMVKFTLVQGADVSEERLKKMALRLKGMPSKAQFDLLQGSFLSVPVSRNDAAATDEGIVIDVASDLTASAVIFAAEMAENATLEIILPAEGDKEELKMSWSLNSVIAEVEANTQYFVRAKISEEGVSAELTGQSQIYIVDWQEDDEVGDYISPDRQ